MLKFNKFIIFLYFLLYIFWKFQFFLICVFFRNFYLKFIDHGVFLQVLGVWRRFIFVVDVVDYFQE